MSTYNDLKDLYFKIKAEKLHLRNEIAEKTARLAEVDSIMTEIEGILSENGKHVYDHFEEESNGRCGEDKAI